MENFCPLVCPVYPGSLVAGMDRSPYVVSWSQFFEFHSRDLFISGLGIAGGSPAAAVSHHPL